MRAVITFEVPGTPVAKGRPRATTVNGAPRLYTPDKTVNYEARVALFGAQAMAGQEPCSGPVRLVVEAWFAPPKSWPKKRLGANYEWPEWVLKKPDADNVLKAFGDALNGICWADDSQVVDARCLKRYSVNERVVVTLELLG